MVTCVTWETSPIAARVLQSETWAAWKDFTDKHDSVCDGQLFRALKEGRRGKLNYDLCSTLFALANGIFEWNYLDYGRSNVKSS